MARVLTKEWIGWWYVALPTEGRFPELTKSPLTANNPVGERISFWRFVSGFRFSSFIYLGVGVSPTWVPSAAFEVLYRFFPSTLLRPVESLSYIAS
jgi:hypothetical protein